MKKIKINADKIYLEIAKLNISVADFASKNKMSRATLFNALNRDETTVKTAVKIANGLCVPVEDLILNTAATVKTTV